MCTAFREYQTIICLTEKLSLGLIRRQFADELKGWILRLCLRSLDRDTKLPKLFHDGRLFCSSATAVARWLLTLYATRSIVASTKAPMFFTGTFISKSTLTVSVTVTSILWWFMAAKGLLQSGK